jgi:dihydroneopterin aldolase
MDSMNSLVSTDLMNSMNSMDSMDSIHVNGIRAYGYVGVFPEEQSLGQWFEVDLTLWRSLSKAGKSDRLEDTLDYRSSIQVVQTLIQEARFHLIEKLAEEIAQQLLAQGTIEQVKVHLTKLAPPIPNFGGSVAIEILRTASADRV